MLSAAVQRCHCVHIVSNMQSCVGSKYSEHAWAFKGGALTLSDDLVGVEGANSKCTGNDASNHGSCMLKAHDDCQHQGQGLVDSKERRQAPSIAAALTIRPFELPAAQPQVSNRAEVSDIESKPYTRRAPFKSRKGSPSGRNSVLSPIHTANNPSKPDSQPGSALCWSASVACILHLEKPV